jgi:hypothetical protein
MTLIEWAEKWRIPDAAIAELCRSTLHEGPREPGDKEGVVQSDIRLKAGRTSLLPWGQHTYLYRNNRGAGKLTNGSYVRWGLANDSERLGASVKSADLIGWEQVRITQEHVGSVIARFLSIEVKRRNWKFAASLEECAQVHWASVVNAQGGRAVITNTDGSVST